jgi:hypothetical protein
MDPEVESSRRIASSQQEDQVAIPLESDLLNVRSSADFGRLLRQLRDHHGFSLRDVQKDRTSATRASLNAFETGRRLPRRPTLIACLESLGIESEDTQQSWWEACQRARGEEPPAREEARSSASAFFAPEDDLRQIQEKIRTASDEAWFWGAILEKHIPALVEFFSDALADGKRIRVLLIDPGDGVEFSHSLMMSAFRANKPPETLAKNLRFNLELLGEIRKSHQTLEVRVADYLAPYTLYAYDPEAPQGRLECRLGSFRGRHDFRPTFSVDAAGDPDWFDYFYDQFKQVWSAARDPFAGTGNDKP